ncbi:MAG: hypothetical protein NTW29_04840 [Bacteroidetes bacterium]|nr:hypothetical protein [Bacteroidota bacterium]
MQNTYILLRNNVESTALTLDDLKKIGLRSSDLLWVECQSVSWRHPEEIKELKDLAEASATVEKTESEADLFLKYTPGYKETESKKQQPVTSINQLYQQQTNSEPEQVDAVSNTPATSSQKKKNTPSVKDTLFSSIPDEPEHTNTNARDKLAILESWLNMPSKKVGMYAGLVAVGAIMMLIITSAGRNTALPTSPQPVNQPVAEMQTPAPAQEVDSTEEVNIPVAENIIPPDNFHIEPEEKPVNNKKIITPEPEPKKETVSRKTIDKKQAPVAVTPVPETKTITPTEAVSVKPVAKENILTHLHLKNNEYNVAAFGGVRNLVLSLHNDSHVMVTKVMVEILYLNPEGTTVKTDNVQFSFVKPGETADLAVNKTSRGVKIKYRITGFETEQAGNE